LELGSTFSQRTTNVPITFISNKSWIGFSEEIKQEIITKVDTCQEEECKDTLDYLTEPAFWEKYKTDSNYVNIIQSPNKPTTIHPTDIEDVYVHLFYVPDCTQCLNTLEHFNYLETKYPDLIIEKHDISITENKELFEKYKSLYSLKVEIFPIAFIGETYITGEVNIKNNLDVEIERCYNTDLNCSCPEKTILSKTNKVPSSTDYVSGEDNKTIKLFGKEINLGHKSLFLNTLIISFVDGLNPCSLWVLMFLLSIVVYSGSRKKIFLIGITFLAVTAVIYGLFITSVLNALIFFYSPIIKIIIVLVAVIFGLINIKDYFWYKKGISLTISDNEKPKIYDRIRNIMNPKNSMFAIFLGTIILAAGVTILEIPCTAGLPLLWANMVANSTISSAGYYTLLGIYMLIYLLDEIVLFAIAIFTLKISKMEEKHGKVLKLFSGLLIFGIGVSFAVADKFMQGLLGILMLTIGCILLTYIINKLYTKKKKK
jgi:thiol-disulfide isomerase/thioredoxin